MKMTSSGVASRTIASASRRVAAVRRSWCSATCRMDSGDSARAWRGAVTITCWATGKTIATVGNYEYGFFWYLGQDGAIGFEAKLTGVLHTAGVPEGEPGPYATEIAPGVAASVHQHFFCARLDMDVDGTRNRVVEIDALAEARSPHNPDGTAFLTDKTVLDRESRARRSVHSAASRRWRVESAERTNRIGEPTAYELIPGEGIEPMALPDSEFRRRARFLDHHLWVTPFAADERYPAGEYPTRARAATASSAGRRPTARSTARTSSSGTRSAPTTCRGSRTGR